MGIDVRSYAQRQENIVRASCVGCGVCAAVCPRGVLRLEGGPVTVRFEGSDNPLNDFASSLLINEGNGSFTLKPLPTEIQFAPVMATVSDDFNRDGHQDLFVAGNLHVSEVETPRADGGTGKILLGKGNGEFQVLGIKEAGIFTARDVRNVALLSTGKGNPGMIVTANNNSGVQLFLQNKLAGQ